MKVQRNFTSVDLFKLIGDYYDGKSRKTISNLLLKSNTGGYGFKEQIIEQFSKNFDKTEYDNF